MVNSWPTFNTISVYILSEIPGKTWWPTKRHWLTRPHMVYRLHLVKGAGVDITTLNGHIINRIFSQGKNWQKTYVQKGYLTTKLKLSIIRHLLLIISLWTLYIKLIGFRVMVFLYYKSFTHPYFSASTISWLLLSVYFLIIYCFLLFPEIKRSS